MTKKVKVSKNKPYVIALGGIAVAICLIGWGTMFKPNNKEETTEEIKIDIEDEPVDDLPLDTQLADMLVDDTDNDKISGFDYTLK